MSTCTTERDCPYKATMSKDPTACMYDKSCEFKKEVKQ